MVPESQAMLLCHMISHGTSHDLQPPQEHEYKDVAVKYQLQIKNNILSLLYSG